MQTCMQQCEFSTSQGRAQVRVWKGKIQSAAIVAILLQHRVFLTILILFSDLKLLFYCTAANLCLLHAAFPHTDFLISVQKRHFFMPFIGQTTRVPATKTA